MPISKIQTNSVTTDVLGPGKNLIINSAMQVAQRGTSETGVTSSGYKQAPDRFELAYSSLGTWTASQSTTAPAGFSNSYKLECTAADASPASNDYFIFRQKTEAQNLQNLKYGTSSAQSLTLSFWVRSSKTGTYVCDLLQPDATNRHIDKSYTIASANTWEYKTITFEGDTSGVFNNDNGSGLEIGWWLGAGSTFTSGTTLQTSWGSLTQSDRAIGQVNLADTIGNDWYITGVQLEVGETATPFEHRSYGDELARCQRYYYQYDDTVEGGGLSGSTATLDSCVGIYHTFPVTMRADPTLTLQGNTGRGGATTNAERLRPQHFVWGRIKTGSGTASAYAFATGGFKVDAEL